LVLVKLVELVGAPLGGARWVTTCIAILYSGRSVVIGGRRRQTAINAGDGKTPQFAMGYGVSPY
jgi:hypothetical protein